MKKIKDILSNTRILQSIIHHDEMITGIQLDSRLVKPGNVFIAVKGLTSDGHDFIESAIEKGARSVFCDRLPEILREGINYIQIENTEKHLPAIVSEFYDHPADKLKVIGVTGTNGKTTIATLLYRLFNNMGITSGLISTVSYHVGNKTYTSTHTTPNTLILNSLFKEMVDEGCEYCFMEVSSHAIEQDRIAGIDFSVAVFTNITHDHLDYHKTFSNYLNAKKKFFDNLSPSAKALVNIDDKNGLVMVQNTKAQVFTYSCCMGADFKSRVIESHFDSTFMTIGNHEIWTKFTGNFNVSNLTAVFAVALLCGLDENGVLEQLSLLKPVSGRFETVRLNEITAIIDYAHTPDALENIFRTIHEIKLKSQNLITVVGAGGDRDKTKRPIMAKLAVRNSDKVILTSDNPRTEPPTSILDDMERGVDHADIKKVLRITDRKEAIKTACLFAKKGDIILIAGKGHETYQEINGVKQDFDDKKVFIEQMEIIHR
ncbi:MAG: UDP-N-acetylmuramoyl-L-alanyl-D-glutamate--2,6-diaminopimelate ligase [Bacteroidales bacterium]